MIPNRYIFHMGPRASILTKIIFVPGPHVPKIKFLTLDQVVLDQKYIYKNLFPLMHYGIYINLRLAYYQENGSGLCPGSLLYRTMFQAVLRHFSVNMVISNWHMFHKRPKDKLFINFVTPCYQDNTTAWSGTWNSIMLYGNKFWHDLGPFSM